MKATNTLANNPWWSRIQGLLLILACGALLLAIRASAADDKTLGDRVNAVAEEAKEGLQAVGRSAEDAVETVWGRIDEKRLKNRNRDEIVAWLMMGMLAVGMAGLMSILRETSWQRFSNVMLGLFGALLGGFAANLAKIDLGMGPILISYEDLLFSLGGGLLLIFLVRFALARKQKKI